MEIKLTRGKSCLVDSCDFEKLSQFKWCVTKANGGFYAARGVWIPETQKTKLVTMHRVITEAKPGDVVDHINGNTLDNRRSNLRIVRHAENIQKMHKSSKGVHLCKARSHLPTPWQAYIGCAGSITPRRHLGYFATKEEAQEAYNVAAKELFGKFFCPPVQQEGKADESSDQI